MNATARRLLSGKVLQIFSGQPHHPRHTQSGGQSRGGSGRELIQGRCRAAETLQGLGWNGQFQCRTGICHWFQHVHRPLPVSVSAPYAALQDSFRSVCSQMSLYYLSVYTGFCPLQTILKLRNNLTIEWKRCIIKRRNVVFHQKGRDADAQLTHSFYRSTKTNYCRRSAQLCRTYHCSVCV